MVIEGRAPALSLRSSPRANIELVVMTDGRILFSSLVIALAVWLAGCNPPPPKQTISTQPISVSDSPSSSEPITPGQEWPRPELSESVVELTAVWGAMTGRDLDHLRRSEGFGQVVRDLKLETPKQSYQSADFACLLWNEPVKVGQTWDIEPTLAAKYLCQFRPEVKTKLNINGRGARGVLRAVSADSYEVLFRLHAQFPLDKKIYLTPSQFDGRLVIDRHSGDVLEVKVEVPRNHFKNLAFEVHAGKWMTGLGVMEEMTLEWQSPERASSEWGEEISVEEARNILANTFYECRKINWLPLEQAIKESKAQKKPLFVLAIAGALDDQSC